MPRWKSVSWITPGCHRSRRHQHRKTRGLLNTFAAIILAATSKTLAFALVILRPMFRQVPVELEEASLIDGCGAFQAFRLIVLPLMRIPLMVV